MSEARRSHRIAGLDAARALAVLAMIFGHTMDAVLSPDARQVAWVKGYWVFRNFTAPLFLFLAGFVLLLVVQRKQLAGWQVVRPHLPRIGLLFLLGYSLRLPVWDWRGLFRLDAELWRSFATFDALQCIASAMLLALAMVAVLRRRNAAAAGATPLALAAAGGLIVFSAPGVWRALSAAHVPGVVQQSLGGGTALFSFFPWSAYLLFGAAAGALFPSMATGRRALGWMAGLGALLLLGTWAWNGWASPAGLVPVDPVKFFWRLGAVLVIAAGAMQLPERLARLAAPVGRASLWAYVIHLPIAYGWGYWGGLARRVGQTLTDVQASLVALGVVLFSATAAVVAKRCFASARLRAPWVRSTLPGSQQS